MIKNYTKTIGVLSLFLVAFVSSQAQAVIPCDQRLISNIDFTYTGGTAPTRWDMSQIDASGFTIDQGAYAYVPSGNFSNQNTDYQNNNSNLNTTRQYAIVKNPKDLNTTQYADIPTDGMIVINPKQGENDQYAMFQVGGLKPGNTYKVEIKMWNVLSMPYPSSVTNNCHNWCNPNDQINILWEGNGNNAHDGQGSMTWSGTNGTNQGWSAWKQQTPNVFKPTVNGSYAVFTGTMQLGNETSGFTFTFSKQTNNNFPIVLGIDYIKIYGCQEEAIVTNTGVIDGGKVCETSSLTLTAQGLGAAGSAYTWTETINGVTTTLPGTGKSITVTTPAGKGTKVTYKAQGEWSSKTIMVETQLCCYDVGDRMVVLEYDFPIINQSGCANTNRGWLNPTGDVRIDPQYAFTCTGNIPDDAGGKIPGYAIIKTTANGSLAGDTHWPGWNGKDGTFDKILTEHTAGYTGKTGTGMLAVNASGKPGIFFEYDLPASAICDDGASYQFSAWYASADPSGSDACNIEFQLIDKSSNTVVEKTSTGKFGFNGTGGDWNDVKAGKKARWQQTTLVFTTAPNKTYMLRLVNNGAGVSGNDVLIDDILITKCSPKIDFFPNGFAPSAIEAEVCSTDPVKFKIEVPENAATPNGSFSDLFPTNPTLYFQLQVCDNYNEITSTGTWTSIGSYQISAAPYGVVPTFDITPEDASKWYRVKITDNPSTVVTTNPLSTVCGVLEFYTRMFKIKKTAPNISVAEKTISECSGKQIDLVGKTTETGTDILWGWAKKVTSGDSIISGGGSLNNTGSKTYSIASGSTSDSGTYYFKIQKGTCEVKDSVKVTITSALSVTPGADQGRCGTGTVTFTATGSGSTGMIYWYTNDTDATPLDSISPWTTPSISDTTSYYVAYKEGGCSSDRVKVTANINPNPTMKINNAAAYTKEICDGASETLTASGSTTIVTYAWTPNTDIDADNVASVTATPTTTTTYTVTGTDSNGCTGTATAKITINPLPAKPGVGSPTEKCYDGTAITGTATGATGESFKWYTTETGTTTTTAPSVTGTANATTTATASAWAAAVSDKGCESTGRTEITVTINPIPTITPTPAGTTEVYTSESITLTGTPTGGVWTKSSSDQGDVTITDINVSAGTVDVAGVHSGNVKITYTVNSCSKTFDLKVLSLSVGNPETKDFCPGDNIKLEASGNKILKYCWYKQGSGTPLNHDDPGLTDISDTAGLTKDLGILTAADDNTIWVFRAYNGTEWKEQKFTLKKKQNYTFSVTPNSPAKALACLNDPTKIVATNTSGATYTWTGNGTASGNEFTLNTSAAGTGAIKVKGIAPNYCESAEISVTYIVNNLKLVPKGTWDAYVCKGSAATPFEVDTTGTGQLHGAQCEIVWEAKAASESNWTEVAKNTLTYTASPSEITSYRVIARTKDGSNIICTKMTTVHVMDVIEVTFDKKEKTYNSCIDQNVILEGNTGNGTSWQWEDDGGTILSPESTNKADWNFTVAPNVKTDYYFVAFYGQCSAKQKHTVNVFNLKLGIDDDFVYRCPGDTITLKADTIGTGSIKNFNLTWRQRPADDLDSVPTLVSRSLKTEVRPIENTTYIVYVRNGDCEQKDSLTVLMHSVPTIDAILLDVPKAAQIEVSGGEEPYRYIMDNSTDTLHIKFFDNLKISYHTVYVIDDNNCKTSKRFYINEVPLIFPPQFTPNDDSQNDKWEIKNLSAYSKITLEIFDRYGRQVAKITDPYESWDGKSKDGKILPSDDYWYVLHIEETKKDYVGHFTLINLKN